MTYRLAEPISDSARAELAHLDPLIAQLLFTRGIVTKTEADRFLAPDYAERHDPFLMTDMEKAVTRILTAIRANERIAIWSDYDCDGIPGAVLWHDFFTAVGFTNFENYIPHRHDEGFGLNILGIDALVKRGTSLIVTLDCGITNVEEVAHANAHGVDVIVTDHHEPGATLPPAHAVLDPKRDYAYPFRELCGSGVAWKLIEGLIARGGFALTEGSEKWWLDMVGLATMADMVPLIGENRTLAHFGMTVLRKTRRKGLHELYRSQRIDPRYLSDDDIGFTIAPRVNAASRMGVPHDAFHLFVASEPGEATTRAAHLERINNERKGVVAAMVKEMRKRLALRDIGKVVVVGDPDWRPSLLGLAANSIVDEHRRPAFVWGRDGRGILKGSCRSDGSISVVALMERAKDHFIEFGGHHASGGFAVREDRIHSLPRALEDALDPSDTALRDTSSVVIDADLTIDQVTDTFHQSISSLSPFGVGNPKPLFRFRSVIPERVTSFGKSGEHTKLGFSGRTSNVEAIAFFTPPSGFTPKVGKEPVDLIAHIERSYFMGRPHLRLRIVDIIE
jgi:single-stranded-DNA-specific exonuclease